MKQLFILLFALVTGYGHDATSAQNPDAVQKLSFDHSCGASAAGGVAYRYCIDRPLSGADDSNVLLFLHGLNANEETWSSFGAQIPEFGQAAAHLPTVISVSFGPAWVLAQDTHGRAPGYYDVFVMSVLPAVEAKLNARVQHRILMGQSMGGFNALQLLARAPQLFEKVALMCPAFSELNPFSNNQQIANYLKAHPEVDPALVQRIRSLALSVFANQKEYANHDPLFLAETLGPQSPRLFIAAGDRDPFGFYQSSAAFAKRARTQGASVVWQPIAGGGHCQFSPAALTALDQFLSR